MSVNRSKNDFLSLKFCTFCFLKVTWYLTFTTDQRFLFYYSRFPKNCNNLKITTVGWEPLLIIYYTRTGSNIKQPILNKEPTLGYVNWGVVYPKSSPLYNGFLTLIPCTDALPCRRVFAIGGYALIWL